MLAPADAVAVIAFSGSAPSDTPPSSFAATYSQQFLLPVPVNAQFTVSVAHDPYGRVMVPGPNGGQPIVSVYRRPLPTTNLSFLSTVMFDGRETHASLNDG